jgi:hypothetical protein
MHRALDHGLIVTEHGHWSTHFNAHHPIFAAMYSEPNVDISTVFCHFEYHRIGALLT